MSSHLSFVLLLCFAWSTALISLRAAPITWGTPAAVRTGSGNSADVSNEGSLVEAYNAALTAYTGGNRTVNGVTFVATTNLLPLDAGTTEFSIATNGGDANYDAILSTADFGGGESTTITIGDGDGNSAATGTGRLEIGKRYQIQVWFVDDRSEFSSRVMGFASSSTASKVNLNDQYVIGTFTADATTQTLFLDTVSPISGFGNCHITAYQIRAITPITPTVTISGSGTTNEKSNTVYLSFSADVSGLDASDFTLVNGSVSQVQPTGRSRSKTNNSYIPSVRHFSALITAIAPGPVQVTLKAGAVTSADTNTSSTISNTFLFQCNGDFNEPWVVEEALDWTQARGSSTNM